MTHSNIPTHLQSPSLSTSSSLSPLLSVEDEGTCGSGHPLSTYAHHTRGGGQTANAAPVARVLGSVTDNLVMTGTGTME